MNIRSGRRCGTQISRPCRTRRCQARTRRVPKTHNSRTKQTPPSQSSGPRRKHVITSRWILCFSFAQISEGLAQSSASCTALAEPGRGGRVRAGSPAAGRARGARRGPWGSSYPRAAPSAGGTPLGTGPPPQPPLPGPTLMARRGRACSAPDGGNLPMHLNRSGPAYMTRDLGKISVWGLA